MNDIGIDDALIKSIENQEVKTIDDKSKMIQEHIEKTLKSLTDMKSLFTNEDMQKELLKYGLEFGISEFEYIQELKKNLNLIELDDNTFSTMEMIEIEKNIIKSVLGTQNTLNKIEVDESKIDKFIEEFYPTMNDGQLDMVKHILQSQDQIIGVQGDAGSGKTYSAESVKKYLEMYYPEQEIVGLAFTGRASSGLEADSGILSHTLHSFINKEQKRKDDVQSKGRILLVDEAGMVGSKQIDELIKIAKKNGDRLVFIGDTKQFKSISAGQAFFDMQKYGMKMSYMTKTLRQKVEKGMSEAQKEEVYATIESINSLKAQKIEKSLQIIEDGNNLFEEDVDTQIETISNNYTAKSETQRRDDLIIASKNADKNALNTRIRANLGMSGKEYLVSENINLQGVQKYFSESYEVGNKIAIQGKIPNFKSGEQVEIIEMVDDTTIKVKSGNSRGQTIKEINVYEYGDSINLYKEKMKGFEKGDLITFTKNIQSKSLRVKNGDRAYIKSIDKKGNVETENGKKFNLNEMNYVDYGYAITDVKSQGATTKNVVIMANSAMANFNSFYTQITRAKHTIKLYTDNKDQLKANIENTEQTKSTLDYTFKDIKKEMMENDFRAIRRRTEREDERDKFKAGQLGEAKPAVDKFITKERQERNSILRDVNEFIKAYGRDKIKITIEEHKEIYNAIREQIITSFKRRKSNSRTYARASRVQHSGTNDTRRERTTKRSLYGLSVSNVVSYRGQKTGMLLPSNARLSLGERVKISNLQMRGKRKLNTSKVRGSGDRRIDKLIQDVKSRQNNDRKFSK